MTSAHCIRDARIFHKISKSLASRGYEVFLVAGHARDEIVDGVHIVAVPKRKDRLSRMTVSPYHIYKRAFALDADIYHFHDAELMPVALLLRLQGKPVVYDAHEDLPRTVSYKDYIPRQLRGLVAGAAQRLELLAARRFTAVIGATLPIADRFRQVNANTVVVHNFPILDELSPGAMPKWQQRSPAVAYVGGISRERGIFELLEAMPRLRHLGCRLALAGWFSPPAFKEKVLKHPVSNQVDCLGILSRKQIGQLLARVQVGIVVLHPEPNFINSMPTKLFEYMSAGIPVVASGFPLWREIVEEARCGLLVDPLQPPQIAEAISYLLTHPCEAEEMGRRGRATVERLFNWRSEESALMALYSSILQQQRLPLPKTIECA